MLVYKVALSKVKKGTFQDLYLRLLDMNLCSKAEVKE